MTKKIRIAEVGRGLRRSSTMNPCSKQAQLEQIAQNHVQLQFQTSPGTKNPQTFQVSCSCALPLRLWKLRICSRQNSQLWLCLPFSSYNWSSGSCSYKVLDKISSNSFTCLWSNAVCSPPTALLLGDTGSSIRAQLLQLRTPSPPGPASSHARQAAKHHTAAYSHTPTAIWRGNLAKK